MPIGIRGHIIAMLEAVASSLVHGLADRTIVIRQP